MRRIIDILSGIVFITILFFQNTCCNPVPSYQELEQKLLSSSDSFGVIVEYLEVLECESAFISDSDGTILIDRENEIFREKITNEKVKTAIEEVFVEGCHSIGLNMDDNCISFMFWKNDQGKDCGIMCIVREGKKPVAEFMIDRKALSVEGWYYYFSDYNEWRIWEDHATE